ncbi:MAG: hypothetical protein RBR91_00275 [Porticoccaceae bacterium]|nr:hypothetical protein [Porticoccaceae bacterium]HLS99331.1 hypothetical protein [Porticoccaceae bacterium]
MKAARWLPVLMVMSAPVLAAAPPPRDATAVPAEDEAPWSIRNGCIDNYLIKRVSFRDDRSGVLELSGDRKVLVTLRNRCSGIRQDGYVHKPVNNRFCEGDTLRVMRSGGICVVDSLEPYVELDGATAPDGQDPRDAGS